MSKTGTVYTETVVHAAPTQFVADAPYQLAIVTLDRDSGADDQFSSSALKRVTVRILGQRVAIGDTVEFAEERNGVSFFRKA